MVNGHHIFLTETVNHVGTFAKIFGAGTYSEFIWALVIVFLLQTTLTFTRWGLHTVRSAPTSSVRARRASR